jgi:hypothetical protein
MTDENVKFLKQTIFSTTPTRLCFVKYFLIEQVVLVTVRCYSKNQNKAGITKQFYYNETEIELQTFEAILKSGSTKPIYACYRRGLRHTKTKRKQNLMQCMVAQTSQFALVSIWDKHENQSNHQYTIIFYHSIVEEILDSS